MFKSEEMKSLQREIERRDEEIKRLKEDIDRKAVFIALMEQQVQAREEKLILLLDPAKYNLFMLQKRTRIGAAELTPEEKKKEEERRAKQEREFAALQEMISF